MINAKTVLVEYRNWNSDDFLLTCAGSGQNKVLCLRRESLALLPEDGHSSDNLTPFLHRKLLQYHEIQSDAVYMGQADKLTPG